MRQGIEVIDKLRSFGSSGPIARRTYNLRFSHQQKGKNNQLIGPKRRAPNNSPPLNTLGKLQIAGSDSHHFVDTQFLR
jgi:hypothetical protein